MADPNDTEAPLDGLDGWGAPEAKPDFADRVLARIDAEATARPHPRRWIAPFALGSVVGGLVGATAATLGSASPAPTSSGRRLHVQAPGIGEVVGEPSAQLRWERRPDGRVVVDVIEGTAWVRRAIASPDFGVVVDGDEIRLGGPCSRIEVRRGVFTVDVVADDVDCVVVDAAIARERAELSGASSR